MWSPQTARQQPHDAIAQQGRRDESTFPRLFSAPYPLPGRRVRPMIGSNRHGHPQLDPNRSCETLLDIPDCFLDLMFTDPPEDPVDDPEDEPERLVA